MSLHRERLRAAVEATVIHTATAYSWFGKRSDELPRSIRRALTPETARSYLHYALQSRLYTDFYCAGVAQPWSRGQGGQMPAGRTPFVEALSAANSGSGYSSPGWTATGSEKGMVVVRKGGVRLLTGPTDRECDESEPMRRGASTLSIRFPKEFIHLSPGFYMAVGDCELSPDDEDGVVRWYWNLTATGAIRLVREVTTDLNRMLLPFKLKVLNDPARFVRCDAVVLYVRKNDFCAVSDVLGRVYPEVASALKPSTPALTKEVAVGVGVAEDPGRGTSFGLHRCGLLAEALIRAREEGLHDLEGRLAAVEDGFVAEGLSLERPYLNPGSRDGFSLRALSAPTPPARGSGTSLATADKASFLETAEAIGRRLKADAIWHRERCTWLGAEPVPESASPGATRAIYRTLGPDLYAGTSGLALYFAELYAATGNPDDRKTALGAMAQSFSNLDGVPPPVRFGLYAGWSGIALAAARVGALLGAPEWIEKALGLLDRLMRDAPQPREFDLLSGTAGGIAALVVLWRQSGEAALLDMAVRLADELLAVAVPVGAGRCWKSVGHPANPGLTGFSHGASGIGYSLFETFVATNDTSYLSGAEAAFDYERELYDPGAENWPDLRGRLQEKPGAGSPPPFQTAWCHGAPGIALARMGAYARTKEARYRDEALIALGTTARVVRAGLSTQTENYSLCHGMAGNADVLLSAHQMLGKDGPNIDLVNRVAALGIDLYGRKGNAWPCGIPEETPGLMLGLSGIGYFYLRLSGVDVMSVLEPAGMFRE